MLDKFRSYQLAMDFYRECQKIKLTGPIKNQFERASLSIVLNLSEGSAKPSAKERRKFYLVSFGSLREVQTILEIENQKVLLEKADYLARNLYRLCDSLRYG